jgi:S-DNA-T family DNA segregation ATPase FtsK/SpoIIIE
MAVALAWLTAPLSLLPLGLVALVMCLTRLWFLRRPVSFTRITGPVRGRWVRWRIRRRWSEVCVRCGLGDHDLPKVVGARVDWPHLAIRVKPALGQTEAHFENAAEAVRLGVGASRLRVQADGPSGVLLTFTVGDELRTPFAAARAPEADLASVVVGRREDGSPWELSIGPQTLVAGCSGSGKGSVFWSFVFALAPAVRDGRVQLHGIDLKGGMEIRMGEPLFTTVATSAAEAVAALELLVRWMVERTHRYAGRTRVHQPSVEEPLHVLMIDELAALTAYCPERELQRRAETAINLLCSQGRAPGFMVFACLQDPRKEVIPSRGLFTQMVGLRLKDLSETSMVLGDVAVTSGAHCHRITRDVPGTGYVLPEDGSHPIRVRAGYAPDELIADIAQSYASPTTVALAPVVVDEPRERRARRTNEVG